MSLESDSDVTLSIGSINEKLRKILYRSDSFGITELVFVFKSKKICDLAFRVREGAFIVAKYEKSRRKKFERIEMLNNFFLDAYNKYFFYIYEPVGFEERFYMFQIEMCTEFPSDILLTFAVEGNYIKIFKGNRVRDIRYV